MKYNKGMTLIELVIVLGLMAALAGMTMTGVADMDERSRANITRERLTEIRSAVLGQPGGSRGFLADMGRYPELTGGGDGKELAALWSGNGFPLFGKVSAGAPGTSITLPGISYVDENGDSATYPPPSVAADDTALYAGWRGPYLYCPGDAFFDGFGVPFTVATSDGVLDSVTGRVGPNENSGDFATVEFGKRWSIISVTAYMRHNVARVSGVEIQPPENDGGGGEENEDGSDGGGEEGSEDEDGGGPVIPAGYIYTYTYDTGKEEQWRPARSDSPTNMVELRYVLFSPEVNTGDASGVGIHMDDGYFDNAGQCHIEEANNSDIYWPQVKLFVYGVVTGVVPGSANTPFPMRRIDCGAPLALNLQPGDNHFDVYLVDEEPDS